MKEKRTNCGLLVGTVRLAISFSKACVLFSGEIVFDFCPPRSSVRGSAITPIQKKVHDRATEH
jgi:hypothetical protein